jgi:hypothetical protein
MEQELGQDRVLAPQLLSLGPKTIRKTPQSDQASMRRAAE